jgi:outer membrane protein assembly factor BamB
MRLITLLLLCLALAGCGALDTVKETFSGVSNYFSGGEDNAEPPAALLEYKPEITIEELWQESVGVGADQHSLKLIPAIGFGKILAADREGVVQARDLNTGRLIWEAETEVNFSAGPGLGVGTVILGSSDADVVALNSENGQVLWKSHVSSEVLSVPVIAHGIVIVRTTDGSVIALNEKTGVKLWHFELAAPALSVRGIGAPVIYEGNVIEGYANGKLMALRLTDGKYVWETSIAIPKGRSEVERLVDINVDPIAVGGVVYLIGYHGGAAAVSEQDGDVLWRNETISSYAGMSHDFRHLYITDAADNVLQLEQRTGAGLWRSKELQHRKLTAPAVYGNYVVVGDFEGYVHWLSANDGRQLGRIKIADSAIDVKPIVVDDTVYIYAKDGTLAALRTRSP